MKSRLAIGLALCLGLAGTAIVNGQAPPDDRPYAERIVTNGMNPNQEYIPPYLAYDPTTAPAPSSFLTARGNRGAAATTAAYYQVVVGPNYTTQNCGGYPRCTFGGSLTRNGWNSDGTPKHDGKEARTVFLNNNDLGYVRDMHCISKDIDPDLDLAGESDTDTRVACWVANYSTPANQEVSDLSKFPPEPDGNNLARDFANAEQAPPDGSTARTPVVMEYRKIVSCLS